MDLWVPGGVADQIIDEAEGRREALRVQRFRDRLKAIDPRLDVFLASTRAVDEAGVVQDQVRIGFWYVYRRNDDGTVAFWEVSNPDGSYREPGEDVIAAFQKGDAARTDQRAARIEARRRREQAREKRERDRMDEMHGQFKERVDYEFRVQVPVTKDLAA